MKIIINIFRINTIKKYGHTEILFLVVYCIIIGNPALSSKNGNTLKSNPIKICGFISKNDEIISKNDVVILIY